MVTRDCKFARGASSCALCSYSSRFCQHSSSVLEHDGKTVPQHGPVPGSRWVEEKGPNLKLILNTGGCKTPTCVFCSFPEFGRAQQQGRPSEVVRLATDLYNARELSLDNDGSLLNPSEVAPSELDEMCLEIRRKNITALRIESNPRFVSGDRVLRVVELSNVRQLTIGMGFQAVGTWPAMSLLGRPDPDALFERAIDVAHECGVQVRLFLLWDHLSLPLQVWSELLKESLRWSEQRKVDYVTVCPHSPPASSKSISEHSLCCLRSTLSQIRSTCVQIECVVGWQVACATGMRCLGCSECEGLLRDGTWSTQGPCLRWLHVLRSVNDNYSSPVASTIIPQLGVGGLEGETLAGGVKPVRLAERNQPGSGKLHTICRDLAFCARTLSPSNSKIVA